MRLPLPGESGLAIFTPASVNARLAKWTRAFNPYHDLIAPHITVAYGGFAPIDAWRMNRPAFAKVIGAIQPFEVTLTSTGIFESDEFVLWLKPEDDGSLMQLRSALAQKFPLYFPADLRPYVPHLTIGFFESRDALLQAQSIVRNELTPIRFRADVVTFMVFGEEGKWGNADHLHLGR